MINPFVQFIGNAFTDELYDRIYTTMVENSPNKMRTNPLESPLREQFLSVFVELKTKKEPLDANFVLGVCHKLLELNQSVVPSIPSLPVRVSNNLDELGTAEQLWNNENGCNETASRCDELLNLSATWQPSVQGFGRKLWSNLTQLSQGVGPKIEIDANVCQAIPNLDFTLTRVTELGSLYSTIKKFANAKEERDCGCVAKEFRSALREEITAYNIYMNKWLNDNLFAWEHTGNFLYKFIPLDPKVLTRFRCLVEATKNVEDKKGCDLISSLVRSGIQEIGNTVLNKMARPIEAMIIRWMIDGKIDDKQEEFFIEAKSSENEWNEGHVLSSTNTLDFLDERQLNDIYQTGKNMRLLLKILGSKTNAGIKEFIENIKGLADQDGLLMALADEYGQTSATVSDTRIRSSALLLEVLVNRHDLYEQLEGFRNYMLFGRGEFYAYIVSELEPYFENDQVVRFYQLKTIVENAYRLTSAENDDGKSFGNLRYRIEEANWNSVKFEFVMTEPLNRLFDSCSGRYAEIFKFLWRLKIVDVTVQKISRKLSHFTKKSYNKIELIPVLRNANALLWNMLRCTKEIQTFVLGMIDDEWERFRVNRRKATCIETVKDAHALVLETIAGYATESLDAYIRLLMNNVQSFGNVYRRFLETSSPWSKDQRLMTGLCGNGDDPTQANSLGIIKKSYETDLQDFLTNLENSEKMGLSQLASRINFNGYYSSIGAENLQL